MAMKSFTKAIASLLLGATITSSCSEEDEPTTDTETFSAQLSVSVNPSSITEGSSSAITFTLSEANTTGQAITAAFSTEGSAGDNDFSLAASNATIADGETSVSLDITSTDDSEEEGSETVVVTLSSSGLPDGVSLGTSSTTITIEDNDDQAASSTLGDEDVTIDFSSSDGNTITISGWSNVTNAEGYVLLINNENSFSDIYSTSLGSTTYVGTGEQVVLDASGSSAISVSLLQESTTYFFKVIPYAGSEFGNDRSVSQSSTMTCSTSSTSENEVCFEIDSSNGLRKFTSNQFPNHDTGRFPNADVTATSLSQEVPLSPSNTGSATYVFDESGGPTPRNQNFYRFGVASNGLGYNPMGLKPWTNPDTGEENWAWQAAVINEGDTDLDDVGGHVTSVGVYHYHGDITGLASDENGASHSKLYGWAADGFPIYYKYGFTTAMDAGSAIKELKSSYQLRSGSRGGNGTDAPDGNYDGTYIQDYEYVAGQGDLDECNGRTGVTPEYPDGTYYYVITADFPKVPNCFMGTPDEGFIIGN